VLVIGLQHLAASVEVPEVFCERERDARPSPAEGGICDRVLPEILDEGDARILDAPELLRMVLRVRAEGRLAVHDPPVDAIDRARRTQVRVAAAILDPA